MKSLIAFIFMVGILFLAGCGDSRYYHEFQLDESSFDAEAMQLIERNSGLDLPVGARGLNFAYSPPIDPAFLARIEVPEESRDFVEAQLQAIEEVKVPSSGGLTERIDWWRPSRGTVLVERERFYSENGRSLHAVLVREDGKLILYVDWST